LGRAKVHATADLCRQINPEVQVHAHAGAFRRSSMKSMAAFHDHERRVVFFCCVDSIATRRLIWEAVRARVALWVDGRMSAEVIRVLTAGQPGSDS
jgi:tRNA A37 threonylcarbamoyladenosine dehydratase